MTVSFSYSFIYIYRAGQLCNTKQASMHYYPHTHPHISYVLAVPLLSVLHSCGTYTFFLICTSVSFLLFSEEEEEEKWHELRNDQNRLFTSPFPNTDMNVLIWGRTSGHTNFQYYMMTPNRHTSIQHHSGKRCKEKGRRCVQICINLLERLRFNTVWGGTLIDDAST